MILENDFSDWLNTSLGIELVLREREFFDREVADVFGFNALQLGLQEYNFLIRNRIADKIFLNMDQKPDIRCDFGALPIRTEAVDLLLMPHVLEFASNPHFVLQEATRVLRPEGHIMISMFNPWSIWGGYKLLKKNTIPWNGNFMSLSRLRDWLSLLNYEIIGGHMAIYIPPIEGSALRRRFAFMEKAGQRWWPFMGGVYFLHAIKKVANIRLISQRWQKKIKSLRRPAMARSCIAIGKIKGND